METTEKLEMSIFGLGVELSHISEYAKYLDIYKKLELVKLAQKILELVKPNENLSVLI